MEVLLATSTSVGFVAGYAIVSLCCAWRREELPHFYSGRPEHFRTNCLEEVFPYCCYHRTDADDPTPTLCESLWFCCRREANRARLDAARAAKREARAQAEAQKEAETRERNAQMQTAFEELRVEPRDFYRI
jgi:hypothetical protein